MSKIFNKKYNFNDVEDIHEFLFINGFISTIYINSLLRKKHRSMYGVINIIKLILEEYIKKSDLLFLEDINIVPSQFSNKNEIEKFKEFVKLNIPIFQIMRILKSNPQYQNFYCKNIGNLKPHAVHDIFKEVFVKRSKKDDYYGTAFMIFNSNYFYRKFMINSLFINIDTLLNSLKYLRDRIFKGEAVKYADLMVRNFDEMFGYFNTKDIDGSGKVKLLKKGDLHCDFNKFKINLYKEEELLNE